MMEKRSGEYDLLSWVGTGWRLSRHAMYGMTCRGLPIAALLACGSLIASYSDARARSHHRSHLPQPHAATTAQPPARVACTVLGCQPIPAACTPVPGGTLSGLPTGYDVIVCPPGISPLR
jgi:hypothetical protein